MPGVNGNIIALNTKGTCSHCAGTVTNTDDRPGCSLTTLVAIHEAACPGVNRGRKKESS